MKNVCLKKEIFILIFIEVLQNGTIQLNSLPNKPFKVRLKSFNLDYNTNYYPKSTKTRIETPFLHLHWRFRQYYYPKSTKTRIETKWWYSQQCSWDLNYYPKSTKTRIETNSKRRENSNRAKIITPNPLKQGLKLISR